MDPETAYQGDVLDLAALRAARAWSLADLAKITGLSRSTLYKLETEHRIPYALDELQRVADAYGVDARELLWSLYRRRSQTRRDA